MTAEEITPETHIVRPRLNWFGEPILKGKTSYTFNGVRVERHGRRIHLLGQDWPVETADGVGRVLIELAEAARAEPDPELLADLKDAIGEHGPDYFEDVDNIARDILARFNITKKRTAS